MTKTPKELNDEARARTQAERDEERGQQIEGADKLKELNQALDDLGDVRDHDFCNDMDYVNGKDLAVVIKRGSPLTAFAAWTRAGRTLVLRPLRDGKTYGDYEGRTEAVEEATAITIDLLNGKPPKPSPTKLGFLGL